MSDTVHEGHDHEGGHEEGEDHEPHEPAAEAEDHVVPEPEVLEKVSEPAAPEPELETETKDVVSIKVSSGDLKKANRFSLLTIGGSVVVGVAGTALGVAGSWIVVPSIMTAVGVGYLLGFAIRGARNVKNILLGR